MHISTVNIFEMVTDRKIITIAIRYEDTYWPFVRIYKITDHGHAYWNCEYLANGERYEKQYCNSQIGNLYKFAIDSHLHLTSIHPNGQGQRDVYSIANILEMVIDVVKLLFKSNSKS